MMEKRRDNKRMTRLGILAAGVILGSSWQISAAQADAWGGGRSLAETGRKRGIRFRD